MCCFDKCVLEKSGRIRCNLRRSFYHRRVFKASLEIHKIQYHVKRIAISSLSRFYILSTELWFFSLKTDFCLNTIHPDHGFPFLLFSHILTLSPSDPALLDFFFRKAQTSETWQEGRKPPSEKLILDHPLNKELQCGTGETGERLGIENKGKGTTCCRSLPVEVPDSQGKFIANEQVLPPYPAPLSSSQPLSPAAKPWIHLEMATDTVLS